MAMHGFRTTSAVNVRQILFNTEPQVSVSVIVSDEGVIEDENGKKIVKAGTPMTGDLEDRSVPFTVATTAQGTLKTIGVALHDVDVTNGPENGTCLIFGFVNLNRLEDDVVVLIDTNVKKALNAKVTFLK